MSNKGKKLAAFAIALSTLFSASISTNAAETAQSSNSEKSTNAEKKVEPQLNSKTAPSSSNKPAGKPTAKKESLKNSLLKFWPLPAATVSILGIKKFYDGFFANNDINKDNEKIFGKIEIPEVVNPVEKTPPVEAEIPAINQNQSDQTSNLSGYRGIKLNCAEAKPRSLGEVFPITNGPGENYFKLYQSDYYGTIPPRVYNTIVCINSPLAGGGYAKNQFQIVSHVGSGSFGETYLAYDVNGIIRALKKSKKQQLTPEERNSIMKEINATMRGNSVHSANIISYGDSDDGYFCLVCDYVPGGNLQEVIQRLTFAVGNGMVDETAFIIYQIAMGLAKAHSQGVIHRDIKPDNIRYVFSTWKIKLIDFGVAKIEDNVNLNKTTIGTPLYMAPEALTGKYSYPVDVWSLGCILHQIIKGRLPYVASDIPELARMLSDNSNVVKISSDNPKLKWLCELTNLMLKKNPAERPTALQVAETILAYHNRTF